jgi:hypothetical protein
VKTINSQTTSATTGASCIAFYPFGSVYAESPQTLTAGGAMTWSASDTCAAATNWSSYAAAMGLYRTVVGGIKVDVTSSLLNTQGRLYVCHVPMDVANTTTGYNFFPATVGALMNMPYSEEYSLAELCEEELVIPFRRISDVSEHYRDSTYPIANAASPTGAEENANGWCAIICLFVGASLTNVVSFDIEHIIVCEGLQLGNDTILATTPPAPFMPRAMEQIYQLNAGMPVGSVTKDPQQGTWIDSAIRKAKNTLKKAAAVAGFAVEMATLFA